MFIVLVMHNCKPGMVEKAIHRIDRNGDEMANIPGFLYRYRTQGKSSELAIGTVTGWLDEASYEAWLEVKKTLPPEEGESPYESATSERHYVKRSQFTQE
jgi:heme-degrading monooxygenase HmoA